MAIAHASLRRARPLLGTFVEIAVAGAPVPVMEAAIEAAFTAVAEVHRLMSFHETDSDVSRLNRGAASGAVRVHDWTYQVLAIAGDLHRRSGGIFNVSVAPALQRLGTPNGAHDAIQLFPDRQACFSDPGVKIDLGGIAKGFAVDRAVEVLLRHGIPDGLVNAGGDLLTFGPRSREIDIRDPRQPDRTICHVALHDASLASSAGRFDPMQSDQVHGAAVVDPMTGLPPHAIRGATICARHCVIADALTKIVMNSGEAAAPILEHYGASALFVTAHGDIHISADWKNEVRLAA